MYVYVMYIFVNLSWCCINVWWYLEIIWFVIWFVVWLVGIWGVGYFYGNVNCLNLGMLVKMLVREI